MTNYLDELPFPITGEHVLEILPRLAKKRPSDPRQIAYVDMLKQIVFDHILDLAARYKLKHISLAFSQYGAELLGDDSDYQGWPTIWAVCRHLKGVSAGCGNSNQYQVWSECFDKANEGMWDVKTRIKIGKPLRLITRERDYAEF